jgi:hypothetical protein
MLSILLVDLASSLQPYLIAVSSAIFGYWFGGWRESRSRIRRAKDEFLAVVADQRAKFDAMKFQEAEFFEQSLPAFTRAAYGMEHFLSKAHWKRLHTILKEYQAHDKREFEGGRTRLAAAINADMGIGKTHEQTLREFVDRFDDCIRTA